MIDWAISVISTVHWHAALVVFIGLPLLPAVIGMPLVGPDSLEENVTVWLTIFSPIGLWQVFAKMRAEKSVGSFNVLSVVTMYLNAIMWMLYGVAADMPPAYTTNFVCAVFGGYYTFTYYCCAQGAQKSEALKQILLAVLLTVGFSVFLAVGPTERVLKPGGAEGEELSLAAVCMGYVCIGFNVLLYAAPLATVGEVLKTCSTESLSLETTLTNMVLSVLWLIAGYYRNDLPTIIPSAIGAVLSAAQIFLFAAFPASDGGEMTGKRD
jgi:solute carrier family 50 protein (sugar transporter)